MKDVGLNFFEIDEVILVGGLICILVVVEVVCKEINKELNKLVNFDEVVVMGVVI